MAQHNATPPNSKTLTLQDEVDAERLSKGFAELKPDENSSGNFQNTFSCDNRLSP